ncbi:hypothetical protein EJ04DRAFT_500635 [Polyplosphaeria fusca]|uniref:HPP transmembrane region domain-containing protein n=1 Tax=Polyplosphaeria fusca TaxID=682080 RepID=A0A9P4UVV8_9PLEO|nr:hypothetical protein EJ04DRAFT_500635 [Polyplosphaeria fusca]
MKVRAALHRVEEWNFDVDHYICRYLPPSPLHRFPPYIARFLGYRKEQKQDVGNIAGAFWSCLGAFCGLAVIAAVFNNTPSIQHHHPPALIASFGASAILEYNAIRSPLGQPRNALLGHTFSALVGVGITKLFLMHSDFEKIKWIAGAVACGISSAVMGLTGTVHPPGGASAVLAATSPEITAMGWYFVPLVMWGTTLMLCVALPINNIQRQFPNYWWTPLDCGPQRPSDEEDWPDARGGMEKKVTPADIAEKREEVVISAHHLILPKDFPLNEGEGQLFEGLMERLKKRYQEDLQRQESSTSGSSSTMTHAQTSSSRDTVALFPTSA